MNDTSSKRVVSTLFAAMMRPASDNDPDTGQGKGSGAPSSFSAWLIYGARAAAGFLLLLAVIHPAVSFGFPTDAEIARIQREIAGKPLGERIAFWAEKFIDVPYDPDPLGEYVRRGVIVADDRVDCMYLTYRSTELAIGKDPDDALRVALDKRFVHRGRMEDGKVVNYEDRYEYGEDMFESGKWGREITAELGETDVIEGARGREAVVMLKGGEIIKSLDRLRSGDIIYFVNPVERRSTGGIVGHMGIIKKEAGGVYVIHASGKKNGSGRVKKALLSDYLGTMPFPGARVNRFETH